MTDEVKKEEVQAVKKPYWRKGMKPRPDASFDPNIDPTLVINPADLVTPIGEDVKARPIEYVDMNNREVKYCRTIYPVRVGTQSFTQFDIERDTKQFTLLYNYPSQMLRVLDRETGELLTLIPASSCISFCVK